jgi:hypothetical protein
MFLFEYSLWHPALASRWLENCEIQRQRKMTVAGIFLQSMGD